MTDAQKVPRLPLARVAIGAFVLPWTQRRAYAKALWIPLLCLIVLYAVATHAGQIEAAAWRWLLLFAHLILFAAIAMRSHRLALLDPHQVAQEPLLRWTKRDTTFSLLLATGYLGFGTTASLVGGIAVDSFISVAAGFGAEPRLVAQVVLGASSLVAAYLFARLSLVLPAVAVDRQFDPRWAWRVSRGNGWRLVIVVFALPYAIHVLLDRLYRDGASTFEWFVLLTVGVVFIVLEITALSLSYRALVQPTEASAEAMPHRSTDLLRWWPVLPVGLAAAGTLMLYGLPIDCSSAGVREHLSPDRRYAVILAHEKCKDKPARWAVYLERKRDQDGTPIASWPAPDRAAKEDFAKGGSAVTWRWVDATTLEFSSSVPDAFAKAPPAHNELRFCYLTPAEQRP
jgi:hypothetical protein